MSLIHPAIIEELSRKKIWSCPPDKNFQYVWQTDSRNKQFANLGTLKSIFLYKFEVIPCSSLGGDAQTRFLATPYGPCPTDREWSKLLSDIKLGTLRNIILNFEVNTSSHYRVVVLTIFFSHEVLAVPYWPCMVNIFVRYKTRDPKKHFLKFWA